MCCGAAAMDSNGPLPLMSHVWLEEELFLLFLISGRGGRTGRKAERCGKFREFRWWKGLGRGSQEAAQTPATGGEREAAGAAEGGPADSPEAPVLWDQSGRGVQKFQRVCHQAEADEVSTSRAPSLCTTPEMAPVLSRRRVWGSRTPTLARNSLVKLLGPSCLLNHFLKFSYTNICKNTFKLQIPHSYPCVFHWAPQPIVNCLVPCPGGQTVVAEAT